MAGSEAGQQGGAETPASSEAASSPETKAVPTTHVSGPAGGTTLELPSEREVLVRRVLNGPRALVWEVWTSPAHLPHWMLGPEGWTMPVCEMDVRPGGAWRIVWRHTDGQEMEMIGTYREVVPPERIVNTERWGPEWPETVNTAVFTEDAPGRTTITLRILYPSPEARDAALETNMTEGMEATFRRVDAYLPQLGAR